MGRRKKRLYLGCDDGASSFKCIGSSGEGLETIVMTSAIIEQRSETLDRYRQQTGDLTTRSFVGIDGEYFAVGKLATRLGATQPLKPLKSETIIYKILGVVSMMAQRLNLGTNFDLSLGCLLPPGEFRDQERIKTTLIEALADFDPTFRR